MQEQSDKTRAAVLTVALGTFMSALDSSVVNIVLPVIQSVYGVSLSSVEWVVMAYLLIISGLLLTFGRLSDLYGHRRIYIAGFSVFTVGSLLCGFSASIGMLITFRVLQALGAGMLFSAGPAIITDVVPEETRGKALSVTAAAVAVALCTGPVLGGLLTGLLGWQSIFFMNVPIGIIGTLLAWRNVPGDNKKGSGRFDWTGSVLVFAALMLILTPLDLLGKQNLNSVLFYGLLTAGMLTAIGFVFYERKQREPILNIALFHSHVFAAGNLAAVFNFMAQNIMIFLAPFYLEKLRMLSPTMAGMLYMPMPLATLLVTPLSGYAADHFDSRFLCSGGMAVMAGGLLMLSQLGTATPYWYIVCAMVLAGLGSGLFQTPNNSAVMGSVSAEYRGTASGVLATMRNTGMVLGVAVSGALFTMNENKAEFLYTAQGLKDAALRQASFLYALRLTFFAAVAAALISMLVSLQKGKKREIL